MTTYLISELKKLIEVLIKIFIFSFYLTVYGAMDIVLVSGLNESRVIIILPKNSREG